MCMSGSVGIVNRIKKEGNRGGGGNYWKKRIMEDDEETGLWSRWNDHFLEKSILRFQ